ncbi:LuxR family transcriptional regulator [Streptomyces sp. ADI98-10]|uniref:helix-turn-helix transcriptional regulator n=1 Tax=Streptomyces sp. ADI98-10 TaxID=1522763 RepID=UPI000F5509FE|nr:LuxR family transcriptional regulator [Streptomyces sp. ADI98-10]RPK83951.1 Bacterial regulatory protein, LuxR family [Streptomyces sp. ADI98-10]
MTAHAAARRPVLNRESELAVIEGLAERGRSVLLTGPPGAGRTRLLQETLRRLCPPDPPGAADRAVAAHHELPGLLKRGTAAGPPGESGHPLAVLGVDDIHQLAAAAAGPLAEAVREGRVRLLATVPAGLTLPAAVDALGRDGLLRPVEVGAFDRAGTARALRARLGGQVASDTTARFWDLTGGNPLLLTELTEGAVGDGTLRPCRGLWHWNGPPGRPVRPDATARRLLGSLDPDEEQLVAVLSLAGPVPDDLPVVMELGPAAERLNRRGIVVAEPGEHGLRLRLGQPLSGHALVAALPALTVRRLRLRLADELEPAPGAARLPADAGSGLLRAVCLRLDAGRRPAAGPLLDAADAALLSREYATAERLVRAALATGGSAADDRAPDGAVALPLGRALAGQGRCTEAEMLLAAADDRTPDAVAARVDNLARGLGRTEEAAALADRAVLRAPRGSVRGTQSAVRLWQDRLDDVARTGDALPRESYTAPALQACVPLAAFARTELGDAPAAYAMLEHCPVDGWQDDARHAHRVVSAHAALESGDLARARDAVERLRRADPARDVRRRIRADVLQARLLRVTGRAPEAVALLRRAASAPDGPDWFTTRAWILAQLAGALAESDQRTEAVRTLIEVREAVRHAVTYPLADDWTGFEEALVLGRSGDSPGALGRCGEVARRAAAAGRRTTALAALQLMARLGPADRAETVLDTLGPFAPGTVAALRAGHIRALARQDAGALDDLAAGFARLGMYPLAAESAGQAHRAWEAAGRHRAGRDSRARSRRHLTACPGTPLPGWAAVVDRASDPEGAVLTVREHEVATLAATRMTNREIAARLTVSVRTIENHLYRVYSKLGVTSRVVLGEHLGQRPFASQTVRSS